MHRFVLCNVGNSTDFTQQEVCSRLLLLLLLNEEPEQSPASVTAPETQREVQTLPDKCLNQSKCFTRLVVFVGGPCLFSF